MTEFCPTIWPEDGVPNDVQNCTDCGLYQQGTRMVWGEGNPGAPIMIVLDNPGARVDREGNPFVCGTRQTLQRAAHESGVPDKDLYVTYILKRRPIRAYSKDETRAICINHLYDQLEIMRPKMIFCLGNVAVRSFFADELADVKSLRLKWHHVRGWKTAVSYHPLAVRRRPNLYSSFLQDWKFISDGLTTS